MASEEIEVCSPTFNFERPISNRLIIMAMHLLAVPIFIQVPSKLISVESDVLLRGQARHVEFYFGPFRSLDLISTKFSRTAL